MSLIGCFVCVDFEDIDLAKKGTDVYSFPESLKYYAGYIPTTKSLIETLRKGEGVSLELIGRIERMLRLLFDTGSKGDVLTKADKLGIANTIVDTLNDTINEQLGPYSTDPILDRFEEFDQVNSGMAEVFNEVRRLIRQGFFERSIN